MLSGRVWSLVREASRVGSAGGRAKISKGAATSPSTCKRAISTLDVVLGKHYYAGIENLRWNYAPVVRGRKTQVAKLVEGALACRVVAVSGSPSRVGMSTLSTKT